MNAKVLMLFIVALGVILLSNCSKEENTSSLKEIWFCSECCDSLGNAIPHYDTLAITKSVCLENNSDGLNNHTWTWTSKVVKVCEPFPCFPDSP
jgi:hypothetical protein